MEVKIIKAKVSAGEFDINDFGTYLRAIKDLASEDQEIKKVLQNYPDLIIQFSIFGVIDVYFQINKGKIIIEDGIAENPNIKFEMTDVVGSGIIKNEIDPISAYLSGDFKINGETALAMKLKPFIQEYNERLGFKKGK